MSISDSEALALTAIQNKVAIASGIPNRIQRLLEAYAEEILDRESEKEKS